MKNKLNKNEKDKNEISWQIAFKNFLNDNNDNKHNNFVSQNGKLVSIFSVGEHNKFEGPDFRNACIQINGNIIIGDIEFHKKASDWINHNHYADSNYNNVILHIIFEEDKFFHSNFETIILDRKRLATYHKIKKPKALTNKNILTNEECKYLSIYRLIIRTKNASKLLKLNSIEDVFFSMLTDFLIKYSNFRTYNFNSEIDLTRIFSLLQNSYLYRCISNNEYFVDVNDLFKEFIEKINLGNISKHLKQEILTNVILPVGFCVANRETKMQLLLWYYTAKSRSKYGILKRTYPDAEQKYIWQQQGMLEYYKNNYIFQHSNSLDYYDNLDIENYLSLFDTAIE